ncbi:MAG TPA: SpoIIE family protein phosphatase [Acidimicrobiales bacterium]|nr:SpoIIE family protein phosphatase [Acidimicrobiales bacterium]
MNDGPGGVAAYRAALARYVDTGREDELEAAYALGRQAVADGVTILDLIDQHRSAVDEVARREPALVGRELIGATFQFLCEALATFEMAQRGYWEAKERARVDRQQTELREQLAQAYLTVDRALDLPDRLDAIEEVAAELVGGWGARCRLVDGDGLADVEGGSGWLTAPIRGPAGETVALLSVDVRGRPPVTDDERFLLREFSHMAGVAVENARQFARERSIALMLQHDLLPAAMPPVPNLDVSVRYLPGEATSHAGGDWYDLFELGDGKVGLVVGDVTGHGVTAAAAMGQLRIAVLAYALAGFEPGDVLRRLDELLDALGSGEIATMVYVIADPRREKLVVANAGHPPPIIIEPGGRARQLATAQGLLLGVDVTLPRRDAEVSPMPPGSHLLLYTDGLIEPLERRGQDGIDRLRDVVEGFGGTADELCRHVLAELAPDLSGDDICILAATLDR